MIKVIIGNSMYISMLNKLLKFLSILHKIAVIRLKLIYADFLFTCFIFYFYLFYNTVFRDIIFYYNY